MSDEKRIAACVKALESLPTEAIENGVVEACLNLGALHCGIDKLGYEPGGPMPKQIITATLVLIGKMKGPNPLGNAIDDIFDNPEGSDPCES